MASLDLNFFHENKYITKSNSRKLVDKLFLNTRLYFILRYARLVLINRKLAIRGKYDRKAWAYSSFEVIKLIEDCGGKIHLEGLDILRKCKEPVVFVSNHMSAMESMIFPALIAPFMKVTFVVKESLTRHFLFGPVMRSCKPISIGRLNSREDLMSVMKQGKEFLHDGISIVIFPQGGRRDVFKPEEFNSLGVKLAKSAGAKVIPIAIKTDFWGNGNIIKDFGPIRRDQDIYITIGEAIEITGNGKEQHDQVVQFIGHKLDDWS